MRLSTWDRSSKDIAVGDFLVDGGRAVSAAYQRVHVRLLYCL
jgi:hypothetical protein